MASWIKPIFSQGKLPGLLILYVLFQPLLDAITSIATQAGLSLTLGMVVRTGFLAAVVLWLLLSGPYEGKRAVLLLAGIVTGYLLAYTLLSFTQGGLSLVLHNLKDALKVFHFLYFGLFLYALYRQRKFLLPLWSIATAGAMYCLVILLAWLTGTSFPSYNSGHGFCGWFFSANDVSNLVLLTAPILLYLCFRHLLDLKKKQWLKGLALAVLGFSVAFSATFIGTKLVYLGVLAYLIAAACWFLVQLCLTKNRLLLRGLAAALALCVLMLCLYPVSPLNAYLTDIYVPMSGDDPEALKQSEAIPGLVEVDRAKKHQEMLDAAKGTWLGEWIEKSPLVGKIDKILSRRLLAIAPILQEYLDAGPATKLLGLGYGQQDIFQKDIGQLVEMEPLALLLRHGIIGFALYYVPFLALSFWLLFAFLGKLKTRMKDLDFCSLMFSGMAALAASLFIGHILQSINVSLFVAVLYSHLIHRTATQPSPSERNVP